MFFKNTKQPESTTSSPCGEASISRKGLSFIILRRSSVDYVTGWMTSRYWHTTVSCMSLLEKLKSSLVTIVFERKVDALGRNFCQISFMKYTDGRFCTMFVGSAPLESA